MRPHATNRAIQYQGLTRTTGRPTYNSPVGNTEDTTSHGNHKLPARP